MKIINNKFDYIERISKGVFFYNLVKKAEYIDIPILKHFMTNDDFISFFLLLNEQYSVHKIRGGEKCNFYLEGEGSLLFNKSGSKDRDLYNFYKINKDCSLEIKYHKLGSSSKYDTIDYPTHFEKTKGIADILVIEFKNINVDRLNISHLQNIINVLYIYMIKNKKEVMDLYDGCL